MIASRRKLTLAVFGAATVLFTVVPYLLFEEPLQATGGPGIIGFEFAATHARAAQIMAEWGAHGRHIARLSLSLDYAYMVSYGTFFAVAGFAIRDIARARRWRRRAVVGVVVPFFAIAAASFDATENVALLVTLAGLGGSLAPLLATACSTIKFTLITVAMLYALTGFAASVRARLLQSTSQRAGT